MSRTLKRTCKFCGDEFLSHRSTAKFCIQKHRIAYNRLPTRIERCMNASLDSMSDIEKIAKDHPDTLHMAIAAMMKAENDIEHKREKLQELSRE